MSILKKYGYVFLFQTLLKVVSIQCSVKIGQVEWVAWDS